MKSWPIFSIRSNGSNARLGKFFLLLILLTVLAALASICFGPVFVSPIQVPQILLGQVTGTVEADIVLLARLPRTAGCLLAGMALAVSGAVIQSVLHNPLAAPNIIGVNSGAGLLVVLVGALAPKALWLTPLAAFFGALLGVLVVLFIAERTGASRITLVLAGVAVSNIFSAGIDAVVTFFPDAVLGYSDFRIGGLTNLSFDRLTPAFWVILVAMAILFSLTSELDILALGSDTGQEPGAARQAVAPSLSGLGCRPGRGRCQLLRPAGLCGTDRPPHHAPLHRGGQPPSVALLRSGRRSPAHLL